MDTLIWLVVIAGQIFGIVRVFGWAKETPKWLNITTGILMIIFLMALIGLASE